MECAEKIKSILGTNPDIFYDENLLKSALMRTFTDDKRTGRILYAIAESGIIDNAKMFGRVDKKQYEQYINTLYEDYGIENALAQEHIRYWLEAFDISYENVSLKTYNTASSMDDDTIEFNDNNEEALSKAEKSFNTLSFSEKQAVCYLFEELDGLEGIVVSSQIADKYKITRSVIVGALRKYESAGLVDSRSLGAKGTYVKVLDTAILSVMKNYAQKQKFINSNLHIR